jgi:16S rRNA (uracil1498-N3)-methyltransferase
VRIHRVYCKSVSGTNEIFKIDETQSHHLIRALRLKEEDIVEVFDGNGISANCKIIKLSKKYCEVEKTGDLYHQLAPKRILTAIIPIIKKNNFNFMIQKLTEIGVNKFIVYKPDLIDQSVAKKNFSGAIEKSYEIIINVCKQCGNNFLPEIEHKLNLKEAIMQPDTNNEIFSFDTEAPEYFNQYELGEDSSITIITGPESGFSDAELELIKMQNIKKRYLGQNILRAETAPIYVSSLIKNHFDKIK